MQKYSIIPGATAYGAFLEIRVPVRAPLHWLNNSRNVLAYLLEGFDETALPDGPQMRAYGVRLLSWFFPLPAQLAALPGAGVGLLETPPPTENGGWYLVEGGVAIRFYESGTFEDLDAICRALLALPCHNMYDLDTESLRHFFSLLTGLLPTAADVSALLAHGGADVLGLGKIENERPAAIATTHTTRAGLLRRAIGEAQNRK
ncbi:MAG: hypothetical protein WCR52_12855 [Bacteroidota bacterium]